MPKALHRALAREAKRRGYAGERRERFIYGTMRKRGWRPKRERK